MKKFLCTIIFFIFSIILYYYFSIYIANKYINSYVKYDIISNNQYINPFNILNFKIEHDPLIDNIIPNNLFQTYYNKSKIPSYIFEKNLLYSQNYNYYLFDDTDAIKFLKYYFHKDVVNRFYDLSYGAHKADLLRYCLLYIYGGVYLDIKTILIKPLDEIFINKTNIYTCISRYAFKNNFEKYIYQGILATPPHKPIFLKLINFITYLPLYYLNHPYKLFYLIVIQHFYFEILHDIQNNQNNKSNKIDQLSIGSNQGDKNTYYLFEESCSSKFIRDKNNHKNTCSQYDRYNLCCSIYDKDTQIFIGRDPTFPW